MVRTDLALQSVLCWRFRVSPVNAYHSHFASWGLCQRDWFHCSLTSQENIARASLSLFLLDHSLRMHVSLQQIANRDARKDKDISYAKCTRPAYETL